MTDETKVPAPQAGEGVELPPLDEECIRLQHEYAMSHTPRATYRDPELECRERQLCATLSELQKVKQERDELRRQLNIGMSNSRNAALFAMGVNG